MRPGIGGSAADPPVATTADLNLRVLPFTWKHEKKNRTKRKKIRWREGGKRETAAKCQREEVVHM